MIGVTQGSIKCKSAIRRLIERHILTHLGMHSPIGPIGDRKLNVVFFSKLSFQIITWFCRIQTLGDDLRKIRRAASDRRTVELGAGIISRIKTTYRPWQSIDRILRKGHKKSPEKASLRIPFAGHQEQQR